MMTCLSKSHRGGIKTHAGFARRKSTGFRGFSLVEVALALGLVSFALIALLGTVPIGLNTAREAMRETVHAHILKQISSDLGMLAFHDLAPYLGRTQYYDYDGKRVTNSQEALFIASLQALPPSYPGSTNLSGLQNRLERVEVCVRHQDEPAPGAFRAALPFFGTP